jgi:hypothetical protein
MADSTTATRLHPTNLDISRALMWWHETELNLVGSANGLISIFHARLIFISRLGHGSSFALG